MAAEEKRWAAQAAADLVMDGMWVGLGTGSTVDELLPALAALKPRDLRCVATSVRTEETARRLGLPYVYLGYWIDGSKKMDYKARFLPQQRLAPSGWLRVEASGEILSEPQD